jgi:hypothetical protein
MKWIKWFLYVFFTRDARLRYQYGLMKGKHVVSMKHDVFGTDLEYHLWKEPQREYLTRREYFDLFNTEIKKDVDIVELNEFCDRLKSVNVRLDKILTDIRDFREGLK